MIRTTQIGLLVLLSVCAALISPLGSRAATPTPIHFTASVDPTPVHPGEVATVTVKAVVDPGWHVYSVIPAVGGPAVTEIVSLTGAASAGATTEDLIIHKFDANFGREVGFHENTATFQRQFRVLKLFNLVVFGSQRRLRQVRKQRLIIDDVDEGLPCFASVRVVFF